MQNESGVASVGIARTKLSSLREAVPDPHAVQETKQYESQSTPSTHADENDSGNKHQESLHKAHTQNDEAGSRSHQPIMDSVIGYTRVSLEEQARSGLGLDAQHAAIAGYALGHSKHVVWISDEGLSAKSLNRPGLKTALKSEAPPARR